MKKSQNVKSWIVGIATLTLGVASSLPADAALTGGYFNGKMNLGQVRADVDVFIKAGADASFGLIFFQEVEQERTHGGFFRIEELPDGTQSWIRLYQGREGVLRSNSEQKPVLKGIYTTISGSKKLRLIPAEGSSLCKSEFNEIEVEPADDEQWQEFQATDISFPRGEHGSRGQLKGNQLFSGSLIFLKTSHDGAFVLGQFAPGLVTLRPQILDPQSLSGWALGRDLVGVGALIYQSRNSRYKLMAIELSANQERCLDQTTWLKSR